MDSKSEKNQKADYSQTIHLPQTSFPMKGNLPEREPQLLEFWQKERIYSKILDKNKNSKKFTLVDGPPYANNSIHLGHSLNKILKDMIVKYQNLSGRYSAFIPGWDCHGLPIEHAVTKDRDPKATPLSATEVRSLCRAEAQKWIDHQKIQFQRLGVFADWQNPYQTMNPEYEAEIVRGFALLFEKGLIYRGNKPVYWNAKLQTALADAEVEYHQKKSPSIYVGFPVQESSIFSEPFEALIWTTTPWTLPSNLAICLHPEFEYGIYQARFPSGLAGHYLVAKGRAEALAKELEATLTLVKEVSSSALENLKAQHPFYDRGSTFVLGDHVTLDAGTGCVHTAPGHGPDDYRVGLKYGLQILSPVGPDGRFTKEAPGFEGKSIWDANEEIIQLLQEKGRLVHRANLEHSYPHCWRSKYPLIYRATPQWFLGLDLADNPLREALLKKVESIQFVPDWGRARFLGMLENRPDWCLSRQRIWGVPVPVLVCKKTGEPLADLQVMKKIADTIENEGGIEAFYSKPAESFLPASGLSEKASTNNPEFGSAGWLHSQDILDVWMDSGMCHTAVQKRRPELEFPADIYLEGSDQHRGWFNSSFLSSMACYGEAPYKSLITHGFIQQSKGVKMSKSKGNAADPMTFCQQSGADILRLWCSHEDFGKDVVWGEDLVDRVRETYRRARNTIRYLLGNLGKEPRSNSVPPLHPIDRWALSRHQEVIQKVTQAYENYEFHKVYHLLNQYMTVDLSAVYFDILKDRLYTASKTSRLRQSSIFALRKILDELVVMLAPVLSFLAEEAYQNDPCRRKESVFLEEFPKFDKQFLAEELIQEFEQLFELKTVAQKQLELKRAEKVIGSSLEAKVSLKLPKVSAQTPGGDQKSWSQLATVKAATVFYPQADASETLKEFVREFLIVSQVEILSEGGSEIEVLAERASGEKCPRCWVISDKLSTSATHPGVCPKCVTHLQMDAKV